MDFDELRRHRHAEVVAARTAAQKESAEVILWAREKQHSMERFLRELAQDLARNGPVPLPKSTLRKFHWKSSFNYSASFAPHITSERVPGGWRLPSHHEMGLFLDVSGQLWRDDPHRSTGGSIRYKRVDLTLTTPIQLHSSDAYKCVSDRFCLIKSESPSPGVEKGEYFLTYSTDISKSLKSLLLANFF